MVSRSKDEQTMCIVACVFAICISITTSFPLFSNRNVHARNKIGCGAHGHCSLYMGLQDDEPTTEESEGSIDDATFYSPNIQLDGSRYRYDLNSDDDHNNSDEADDEIAVSDGNVNEYSFFDEAIIYVRAGSGGQGSSTFKKGVGKQNGPPDGGNGGKGGSVILIVDESLNTLAGLTHAWRPNSFGGSGASYKNSNAEQTIRPKSFKAEIGNDGMRQFKDGRYGKDMVVRVPPGTVVQEEIEHDNDDETDDGHGNLGTPVVELSDMGSVTLEDRTMVVACGGEGGEGSGVTGKKGGRGVRRPRMAPEGGERKRLKLTLKIVADVALVGVPNCGKSTLLAAVTRAKPKIANYPFTTVIPNLGVWIPPEAAYFADTNSESDRMRAEGAGSSGLVLCDVPGLIAGAAKGVGLGHAFLRHVERCHIILHLVDATSNDPLADFNMVNREIMKYGTGQLAKMPQIVVVNKMDAFEGKGEEWEKGMRTRLTREELEAALRKEMTHTRLLWMSAKEKDGVDDLMARMQMFTKKVKESI